MIALLLSRGLGALGFQILTVWLGFQIYRTTGSFIAMGSLGLSFFAANLTALVFGGWIVDRFFRRSALALFFLQTALALVAAYLFFGVSENPQALLVLAMVMSFLRQIRSILYVKTLSGVVARGGSSAFLAKWNVFSWQAALFIGPLLFSCTKYAPAIAVACLATSALALLWGSETQDELKVTSDDSQLRQPFLGAMLVGWKTFRASPPVFKAWLADSAVMLWVGATALLPFLLARQGINPQEVGTVRSALALGALAISFLLPSSWVSRYTRSLFGLALIGVGIATACLLAATSLNAMLLTALAIGVFDGISVVIRDEWLLRSIPRDQMGSVGAITLLMISISDDLGEFRAGALASWMGVSATLMLGAAVSTAAGAGFLMPVRGWISLFQRSDCNFFSISRAGIAAEKIIGRGEAS